MAIQLLEHSMCRNHCAVFLDDRRCSVATVHTQISYVRGCLIWFYSLLMVIVCSRHSTFIVLLAEFTLRIRGVNISIPTVDVNI